MTTMMMTPDADDVAVWWTVTHDRGHVYIRIKCWNKLQPSQPKDGRNWSAFSVKILLF